MGILRYCIILLLLLPMAYPSIDLPIYLLDAKYSIGQNNSVMTFLNFTLSQSINRSIIFESGHNISQVLVYGQGEPLNFSIIKDNLNYGLNISINKSINKLAISYVSSDFIFAKENINLFQSSFSFDKPVQKLLVKVRLPLASKIYNSDYVPDDASITTDGETIMLEWSKRSMLNSNSFSVKYQPVSISNNTIHHENVSLKKTSWITSGISLILLMFIIVSLFIYKKKITKVLLSGFYEDEQKVILLLKKKKTVWQNQITKEFGFSRAKTTRIIAKLESKGLIKKEEFGRTNKIHLA